MVLTIGTQLGVHEITALLGKGGMGEVYRARDSRPGRDVAVKVLPDSLAQRPERIPFCSRKRAEIRYTDVGTAAASKPRGIRSWSSRVNKTRRGRHHHEGELRPDMRHPKLDSLPLTAAAATRRA